MSSIRPSTPGTPLRPRLAAVDLLRGVVMVLMVLDHTRDFAHAAGLQYDATDLARTTIPAFVTRWVTHLCAPTFVFLAGTGAYLQRLRGKSRGALARFLVTRGLWLIVLEFTVVNVGVSFDWDPTFLGLAQVIWVIGISMAVLAALLWLPDAMIGAFGLLLVAGHNAFDGFRVPAWGGPGTPLPSAGAWIWTALHQPGLLPVTNDGARTIFILYPLVPWVGVMAVGYAFGAVYRSSPERRARRIGGLGATLLCTFLVLRAANLYGDPVPWSPQSSPAFTALSFLKVEKYPPSLAYVCVTLGVALLLLAWFERRVAREAPAAVERALITFGRVPLFFYILQWFAAHGIALAAMIIAGQDYARLLRNPLTAPPAPTGTGFSLPVVYGLWVLAVVLLYGPCRWYAGVKARRSAWWLSYM